MQDWISHIDEELLDKTVEALLNADHILVTGARSSYHAANWFGNRLNLLLGNTHIIQEFYDPRFDLLNHIRTLYSKNGIQKELRNRSRPLIQKYTKDFFDEFNFNYSDLTLDEDYEVTVFGPEGEASMSMVSGGEKIAIALALRLGITKAKAKGDLDTILLDEPTIHLDSFRRHELINLLKDMTVLPQMIIVTHESQLENAADNLVKVEKNNGISKVSN